MVDRYRYWRNDAIVDDLDQRRHPFHVAIENWQHDFNIGAVVRNANAFAAAAVHIVGLRRWNRRGAMVTDRYQHLHHHATVAELVAWASGADLRCPGVRRPPARAAPAASAGTPSARPVGKVRTRRPCSECRPSERISCG